MSIYTFGMIAKIIIALFNTIITFRYFGSILTIRYIQKRLLYIIFTVIWIDLSLCSILYCSSGVLILSSICIYFFLVLFLYDSAILVKFFFIILLVSFGILTEVLASILLSDIYRMSIEQFVSDPRGQIVVGLLSKIGLFLIVRIICTFNKSRKATIPIKYGVLLLFILVSSILITYQISTNLYKAPNVDHTLDMISNVYIFYIIIMTFILFDVLTRQAEERLRFNLSEHQLDLQLKHYRDLNETRNVVRGIWHDLKNHLISINELALSGNCDLVINYVQGLNGQIEKTTNVIDTGNIVLDAIVCRKREKALENDINMDIRVLLPENIGIDPIDISIVLGNTLDNAIEACARLKDDKISKKIWVEIYCRGSYFIVTIVNSSEECLLDEKGNLKTTKSNNERHGFGIQNIKKVIEKYNGNIVTEYNNNTFTLIAAMQMQY